MPPKATISKEKVLRSALEIVSEVGFSGLSARHLAQRLGCSTQPVYRAYGSMDELKKDVLEQAGLVAMSYLQPDEDSPMPFLQMGLGSLHFAQQEPHLFRVVAERGPVIRELQQGQNPPEFALQNMRSDPMFQGLTDEQLCRIHTLMWFFSQGLATLFFAGLDEDPMERAKELLMLAGRAVLEAELTRREP